MLSAVRQYLEAQPDVLYAIVFGSRARGTCRPDSDLDLALCVVGPADAAQLGACVAALEALTGVDVDLTLLSEAPPALAWRIFREGRPLLVRDRAAFAERKARAILEWLDFAPCAQRCADGVLARAARG
jgi:predicted nucleotidyltransferase